MRKAQGRLDSIISSLDKSTSREMKRLTLVMRREKRIHSSMIQDPQRQLLRNVRGSQLPPVSLQRTAERQRLRTANPPLPLLILTHFITLLLLLILLPPPTTINPPLSLLVLPHSIALLLPILLVPPPTAVLISFHFFIPSP